MKKEILEPTINWDSRRAKWGYVSLKACIAPFIFYRKKGEIPL